MNLIGANVFQPELIRRFAVILANFATACTYDRCVAGERLRTVISSIIRRRRGLIAVIGLSCLRGGLAQPKSSQTGDLPTRTSSAAQRLSSITVRTPDTVPFPTSHFGYDPANSDCSGAGIRTISEEHFAIDLDKIEEEKQLDGIFVLRINTDLTPIEPMLCYKQLWTIEQIF